MLLLGMRAVVRRGVTVCIRFPDTDDPGLPFYLQDINWVNAATHQTKEFEPTLAERVRLGFKSLSEEPSRYLDLPVYDAVRRQSEPGQLEGYQHQLLVLCNYGLDDEVWGQYKERATRVLDNKGGRRAGWPLRRVQDQPTGRLTSWAAFEAIRRAELCLFDWTGWRPNVFFELGARLAASRLGGLHLIDQADDPHRPARADELAQSKHLSRLFGPHRYDSTHHDPYKARVHGRPTSIPSGR